MEIHLFETRMENKITTNDAAKSGGHQRPLSKQRILPRIFSNASTSSNTRQAH